MWRITYKIDNYNLDNDNYSICNPGEIQYAFGETTDEAMKNLIQDLIEERDLEVIIDSCINPSPYISRKMDIISCEIIAESEHIDFYNHPLFLSKLEESKIRDDERKAKQKADTDLRKTEKERAEFERLKKIYDNG
jgi:hypothetical protein